MNTKRITQEVIAMKASGKTYSEIGIFMGGISRQRVQQLFTPSRATCLVVAERAKAMCEECGVFDQFGHFHHVKYEYGLMEEPTNIKYLCGSCHRKSERVACLNCGRKEVIKTSNHKFCCRQCKVAYHSTSHTCSNCGKIFLLSASKKWRIVRNQSGNLFCSKRCQGLYVGHNHRIGIHPKKGTHKYEDLIPEIAKRIRDGQSFSKMGRDMGIPQGSLGDVKKLLGLNS